MSTLKLGFALEGNSDYPVIPVLARRIVTEQDPNIVFANDSILRPRKRGHGFIRELPAFVRQLGDDGVAIVVAVVDTDSTYVNDRFRLLREAKERCAELQIAVCIAEGLAVRAVEAWLLADEAAVFSVFDGDHSRVTFPPPEADPAPKNTLNSIVRTLTSGREIAFASYADELSRQIRLDVLRRKCSHFADFSNNLVRCLREWQRLKSIKGGRRYGRG